VSALNTLLGSSLPQPLTASDVTIVGKRAGSVILDVVANVPRDSALKSYCQTGALASSLQTALPPTNAALYLQLTVSVTAQSVGCPTGYTQSGVLTASCPTGSLPTCLASQTGASGSTSGGGLGAGATAGVALVVVAAIVLLVVVVVWVRRSRRSKHQEQPGFPLQPTGSGRNALSFTNPIYAEDMPEDPYSLPNRNGSGSEYDVIHTLPAAESPYSELPHYNTLSHKTLPTSGQSVVDDKAEEPGYMELRAAGHDDNGYMDISMLNPAQGAGGHHYDTATPNVNHYAMATPSVDHYATARPGVGHDDHGYMDISMVNPLHGGEPDNGRSKQA